MKGLREHAIQHLSDINLMHNRFDAELNQTVLPWLLSKVHLYMMDDAEVDLNAEELQE